MSRQMLSVAPMFVRLRAAITAAALVLLAAVPAVADVGDALKAVGRDGHARVIMRMRTGQTAEADRKSTRLNSSHT